MNMCNPGIQTSTDLGFWVTLAGCHPHTALHHGLPAPAAASTHRAVEGSHGLSSHGKAGLPIPREQLGAMLSWCCCSSQMLGKGESGSVLEAFSRGTDSMGWAATAPWLNHPYSSGCPASGEHSWGREVSTAGERCPQQQAECPRRQERHSWGIPALFASCPSRAAGSPCESLALCIQLLSLDCSWRFRAACREA